MDWTEARRKLFLLAPRPRRAGGGGDRSPPFAAGAETSFEVAFAPPVPRPLVPRPEPPPERLGVVRAASLCVASGKGGTGKSVVTAALATLFSARGRTLLADLDLGVGNAHILQDVSPAASLVEVVEGEASVRDVLVPCSGQVDLLAAGSGVPRMADLSPLEMHLLAAGLAELDGEYRFLLVDSAAGISLQTLEFARACDVILIVTTPDLTAMTDAYAFLKVIVGRHPGARPMLLVNRARHEHEAREVAGRIGRVCRRFLGRLPPFAGWIPEDSAVIDSVNRRGSVVFHAPASPAATALRRIAVGVLEELHRGHAPGMGRTLLRNLGHEAPVV